MRARAVRNGAVFDGAPTPAGHGVVVDGRPDRRAGPATRTTCRDAATHRWSTWPAGWSPRASSTPTCTPSRAGWSGSGATSRSCRTREDVPRRDRRRTPTPTPTAPWILGRRLGDGGVPRRHADRRRPRQRGAGPAGVPAQPRPPRRLGQHPRPRARRARRRHPRPGRRPDRAGRRRAARPGPCTRARWTWSSALAPATTRRSTTQGFLAGQAYLHSVGVTGWQDAILGDYAGMDDPSDTYLRAAVSGDLTATVVGALWWDRDRGAEQVADLVERRAAYTHGRLRAGSVKVMQDGVAENFTAAMGAPYLDRCGHATDNRGHSFVDGRGPAGARRRAGGRGLPGARARDRRPGGPGGAGRLREGPRAHRRRPAPPHRAPAGGPPRRRAAVRRARGDGQHAGAVGLPRRADDRADAALPGCRSGPVAVPLRRPAPRRRPAGRGQRLAGQLARPAGRDPRRRQPVGVRRAGARPATSRSCPEQALDLATAFAAYTSGSARVCHRDRARACSPPGTRPIWWCSTATRSPDRRPRSARRGSSATWVAGRRLHG